MRRTRTSAAAAEQQAIEICILAGGLSTRMGRDKARLLLGGRSMLALIRRTARETGCGVRIIRRDLVPRCGPLGGIYTGLATTAAGAVLFLACDMPFVTVDLLKRIIAGSRNGTRAAFASRGGRCGFPCVLPVTLLPAVEAQRASNRHSVQDLACATRARRIRVAAGDAVNINTPAELARARRRRLSDAHSPRIV